MKKLAKKVLCIALTGALSMSLLSACGAGDGDGKKDADAGKKETVQVESSIDTTQVASVDEGNEAEKEKEPGEPVASEQHTVKITESAYEDLYYIGTGYLMSYSDGKYVLVDHDMKPVEELPYDIPNGWTDFRGNQQDGRFIVNVTLDDGTIQNEIFTPNLELAAGHKISFGYITDYRDAIILQDYKVDDGQTVKIMYSYDELIQKKTDYIQLGEYPFLCASNGFFIVCGKTINSDTNTMSYYYRRNYMGDWFIRNLEPQKMVGGGIRGAGDKVVEFNYNGPNAEGWISGQLGEWIEKEEDGETRRSFEGESGFYNLNEKTFVKDPEINGKKPGSCAYFTDVTGFDKITVIKGRAVENFENEDGTTDRYIFNVLTGEYESDEAYSEVRLGYGKWIPVKTRDGKWEYLNSDTLVHEGLQYDYVSDFCNGYAVVVTGGKAHLLNDKLERASEDFDTSAGNIKSVKAVEDYFIYSDLNGQSVFFVYDDAGCHLLKVN